MFEQARREGLFPSLKKKGVVVSTEHELNEGLNGMLNFDIDQMEEEFNEFDATLMMTELLAHH